jgi:hypothetical protein
MKLMIRAATAGAPGSRNLAVGITTHRSKKSATRNNAKNKAKLKKTIPKVTLPRIWRIEGTPDSVRTTPDKTNKIAMDHPIAGRFAMYAILAIR